MDVEPQQDSSLLEFMYACPIGLVQIDETGTITLINPHAMQHLLPIAVETRRDMTNLFSMIEDCAPELRNLLDHFELPSGTVFENHRIVVDLRKKGDSGRKVLACTMVKISPTRSIITLADITKQIEQEHRLRLADTWFSSLLDGVNDYAVLAVSSTGIIETVNDAFTRQTGHACLDVRSRPLSAVLEADAAPDAPTIYDHFRIADRDGWALDENWQWRQNGERYRCQRLIVARVGDDGVSVDGYTVVLRDVVHQATDASALRRILTQDHLTGAANRGHFLKCFERAYGLWRHNQEPLSLVMIDVDHFKSINDRYGHPAGDLILKSLTQTCMSMLRPDNIFARLGGEEFAVLLPNTSLAEAISVAERLRVAVESAQVIAGQHKIHVTASFGCVTADEGTGSVSEMIRVADDYLYEAKHSGRNRVCSSRMLVQSA